MILAIAAALYVAQTFARLVLSAPDTFDVTLIAPETAVNVVLWLDVIRAAAMAVAGVVMLARLARSHGSERRMLAPVLLAGAASMVSAAYTAQYAMQTLGFIPVVESETIVPIAWVFNVIRVVVPLTILYGVLQLRGARSAMAGAVADVGNAPTTSALRDALATALGDRDLQILAWDHAAGTFRALLVGFQPHIVLFHRLDFGVFARRTSLVADGVGWRSLLRFFHDVSSQQ